MNQNQLAELFDTSKQNIGQHIKSIREEKVKQLYAEFDKKRKTEEAKIADLSDIEELEKELKKNK
ncbi:MULTISPECIES: hypothetical protein [Reichenbachiella]|uniref:HTH cro/C1-type domain-containing protein n=1 Tax=Reichenbachiella agarivorans TaxID=2979464 RepID=A0ABY6CL71_9BACT|nr:MULTISPECIES: hypothetical protein [Reichenbachiella]MBU2913136.1 hypothetical protein [Reichenbachiella agariperforans]UXP31144.1 hypothetical protein N6H18_12375 [Reichenbachiella agarivorans]